MSTINSVFYRFSLCNSILKAASIVTRRLAATGSTVILSKTAQLIVNTAIYSSFTISTANLINNLASLVDKLANNEKLTKLELSTFAISLVFWTNSMANLQTAENIIKATQQEVLNSYPKDAGLSKRQTKLFKSMLRNTIDESQPHDTRNPLGRSAYNHAKAIRSVRQINDPKEFFKNSMSASRSIKKVNRELVNNAPNALRLGLGEYNCMSINNELKIAPKDFVDIPLEQRKQVLRATQAYVDNRDQRLFSESLGKIDLKSMRTRFELEREVSLKRLSSILNRRSVEDYECANGKRLFRNLTARQKDRVIAMESALSESDERAKRIAVEFAARNNPQSLEEYAAFVESALVNLRSGIEAQNVQRNTVPSQCLESIDNIKNEKMIKENTDLTTAFALLCSCASEVYKYKDIIDDLISSQKESVVCTFEEGDLTFIACRLPHENQKTATQVILSINQNKEVSVVTMFDESVCQEKEVNSWA